MMKRSMTWLLCLLLMCVGASALAEGPFTPLDNLQLSQNEKRQLHVDWSASAQEGPCYLVLLMDTENVYTTFEFYNRVFSCDLSVVPGRKYQVEVFAGPDEGTLLKWGVGNFTGKFFFTLEESYYGDYQGDQNCELGWEEDDSGVAMIFGSGNFASMSDKPKDKLDPVTVSKLVDPNVVLYLNFLTTYPEAEASNLTIALYAPDGQCYDKTRDFSSVADYQQGEGYAMSINELFLSCNEWSASGLAAGEYVIRYALDGQWAGQTSFEVLAD